MQKPWRSQIHNPAVEQRLVQDLLSIWRGNDGLMIKLDPIKNVYKFYGDADVPPAKRKQALALCELGFLFRKVQSFLLECKAEGSAAVGVVGQAFCAALEQELAAYQHTLTLFERGSRHPIPTPSTSSPDSTPAKLQYLTILRLSVLFSNLNERMHILAAAAGRCRGLKGGALVGTLQLELHHGATHHKALVSQLLQACCEPILENVQLWVYQGVLQDPRSEFFVVSCPGVSDDRLWQNGYRLEGAMLPAFFPHSLGTTVLRAGKSINFLRRCCQEQEWTRAQKADPAAIAAARVELSRGRVAALQRMVNEAAAHTDAQLVKVLMEKFRFMEHCLAIKRYLFLARAEFVQDLMERVSSELNRPAREVSILLLKSALLASLNNNNESDLVGNVDVKLLPHRDGGTRGWKVFALDYGVSAPLAAVLTEETMLQYRKIFNFLWCLNRVLLAVKGMHFSLKEVYRLQGHGSRLKPKQVGEAFRVEKGQWGSGEVKQLLALPERSGENGEVRGMEGNGANGSVEQEENNDEGAVLADIARQCMAGRWEMHYFVKGLQSYIMLEVVENAWTVFQDAAQIAQTLDELVSTHQQFVASLWDHLQTLQEAVDGVWDAAYTMQQTSSRLVAHVREMQMRRETWRQHFARELSMGSRAEDSELPLSAALLTKSGKEVADAVQRYRLHARALLAIKTPPNLQPMSDFLAGKQQQRDQHMNLFS